jgi:hypothetical protein
MATPRQRKVRNILVRTEAQLYYGLLFAGITGLVNVGMLLCWVGLSTAPLSAMGFDVISLVMDKIQPSVPSLLIAGGLLILNMATAFLLGIVISHRTFGPTVPIIRQLDRLNAGNYAYRIRLRRGDHLADVAAKINQLTDALAAAQGDDEEDEEEEEAARAADAAAAGESAA